MRFVSFEEFVARSKTLHDNKYKYHQNTYNLLSNKTKITCPVHGDFYQTPSDHLGKCGCPACGRNRIREKRSFTFEKFVAKANEKHKNKYQYDKTSFSNCNSKVKITCPEHGEFYQRVNAHISGQGCRKCSFHELSTLMAGNLESFVEKAIAIHGSRYTYSETIYVRSSVKVAITCSKHGNFFQTPNNHLAKRAGCPSCNASKGELMLEKIFLKNNIPHSREYRIPGVSVRYEYDFHLPNMKTLIEFQGIQHFKPIEYFGGAEAFRYLQKCDSIKRDVAKKAGYQLVYFDYKQLKSLTPQQFEEMVLKKIGFSVMFGMPALDSPEMEAFMETF